MSSYKFLSLLATVTLLSTPVEIIAGTESDSKPVTPTTIDPFWNNATVYFMLTDRFNNGDHANDLAFSRQRDGAVLRDFMGGDLKGITEKIEEGYFSALGVNVIWMTPFIEQIRGFIDDEWGKTYAYHGYWPRDWTRVDPNFGTAADLKALVDTAHRHGIRLLMDVIINHTGPVTALDAQWPDDWVRTGPTCLWNSFELNVSCTLNDNLPDVLTEKDTAVSLPPFLLEKWAKEGRVEQEQQELDAFFARTGYARTPRYYIVKWLTDWVRDYGFDGFRVDTAKHVEAEVWQELKQESQLALSEWKQNQAEQKLDDKDFFMVGEVMHFGIDGFGDTVKGGRAYDYGDKQVDFFDYGFESLINMGFAAHAHQSMEDLFSSYSRSLNGGPLEGHGVLNYIASHDDGAPFDPTRERTFEAATKLMLAPGAAQIYYGDEIGRILQVKKATGDAVLRSFIDWDTLNDPRTQKLLQHWQKLGIFRQQHPAVGAGVHQQLKAVPYIFKRTLDRKGHSDKVLVADGLSKGVKSLPVFDVFSDGTVLKDYYSGQSVTVKDGAVEVNSAYSMILLGESL